MQGAGAYLGHKLRCCIRDFGSARGLCPPAATGSVPGVRPLTIAVLLLCASCKKHQSGFEIHSRIASSSDEFSSALQQSVGSTMRPGNRLEVVENGRVFDALIESIGQSRMSVNAELYIWRKGAASNRVLAALAARTAQGVKCRVLLDAVGSIDLSDDLKGQFAGAGCELRVFRPLSGPDKDARNHRKVVVIDGRVGFTGGFGVDDKWLGDGKSKDQWRDTNVRVEGAAVREMQETFAENWQEAGGELLAPREFPKEETAGSARAAFVRSNGAPVVTRAERLTQLAIAAAHRRLWIENAYFAPSKAILDLLSRRASEGVDVRIVTAGRKSDSKLAFFWAQTDYGELQKRGVRVWEYQASMIHAKTILVDESLVVIGSVNLDPLSLNELEEGALVAEDAAAAARLASAFEEDCGRSKEQH